MARLCMIIGGTLAALGAAVALFFAVTIARDAGYRKAELAVRLNQGNVMYEAEFKGAQAQRAFEVIGAAVGVLLALNGATLAGLGIVAARVRPD